MPKSRVQQKSRTVKIRAMWDPITLPEILLDKRTPAEQLKDACAFFFAADLPESRRQENGAAVYADAGGMIGFIAGTAADNDPVVRQRLSELKHYLVAIADIVTDYVNRFAEKYGAVFRTDPELWSLAFAKVPLMGPGDVDSQMYVKYIQGTELAASLAEQILDVAPEPGGALDRFKRFLGRLGDILRSGVRGHKDCYRTVTLGIAIEVVREADKVLYIPRIRQYHVSFDRSNMQWVSACGSEAYMDIRCSYMYAANVLDNEALEDAGARSVLEEFIRRAGKAGITDAPTFFNEDF